MPIGTPGWPDLAVSTMSIASARSAAVTGSASAALRTASATTFMARLPSRARRFLSMSCRIIGVRMSCMARSSLLPGMTMEFARDMKLSWII